MDTTLVGQFFNIKIDEILFIFDSEYPPFSKEKPMSAFFHAYKEKTLNQLISMGFSRFSTDEVDKLQSFLK